MKTSSARSALRGKQLLQVLARVGVGSTGHFLGAAASGDCPASFPAFWPQVDDPVGGRDKFDVMFNYYYGIALVN